MTIPNDKLEQHHLQQLSALKDGELAADEARFLLRRLQHDDELKARWDRWHVVGEALRGDAVAPASSDFAARVGQAVTAIAAEPIPAHADREFSRSAVLRWGGALAASVAALALFVGMPGEQESIAPITAAVAPSVESLPEQANAVSSPDVVPAQVAAVPQQASAPPAATVPARGSTRQLAASGRSAPLRRVDGQRTDASSDPIAPSIMVAEVPPQNEVVEAAGLQNPPRPAARPWPRSVLQGGEGAYQAGYMTGGLNGNTGSVSYFTGQTALPLQLPESSSIEPDEEPQGPARE